MTMNELCFTVLGPSGCGKTTLLACMNDYFTRVMPSAFQADARTFGRLSETYSELKRDAESTTNEIIFTGGIEGTDSEKEYPFTLKGTRKNIPLKFFDFPGTWLNPESEHFAYVAERARQSSVIIAVINSPYLMHYDGKYAAEAGIRDMEYVIANSLGTEKLIILVPAKCERYLAADKDTAGLCDAVTRAFAGTLRLAGSESPHYGKLAVVLLPVKTMGNVALRRFDVRQGKPELKFERRGTTFSPENTDQPLRYAMSFLLEQYKKSRSGLGRFLDIMFSGDIDQTAENIRAGIRTDIRGMKILAGRELLGIDDGE